MAEVEKQEKASDDGTTENKGREAGIVPDFPTFGFDVKSEKTDLVFTVENYRLYAKRTHLVLFSPVFESQLEENPGDTLTIEGVKCADFAEFLARIQPRNRRKVSKDNVSRMLALAKKYDVEDLIERCEVCLVEMLRTSQTGIKTITTFLDYAFKFDLEALESECLKLSAAIGEASMNDRTALEKLNSDAKCQLYETWLPKLTTKARLADIFLTSLKTESEQQLISGLSESRGLAKIICESCSYKMVQSQSLNIWDIKWQLEIIFPSDLGGEYTKRCIRFNCQQQKGLKIFTCPIMVLAMIPNHIMSNENKSVVQLLRFVSWKYTNSIDLPDGVDDPSLGFKLGEKLTLNIQLLFGKPVYHG